MRPVSAGKAEKFEVSLKKLEETVRRLEEGDLSLEDSLKSFEDGMKLAQSCRQRLEEAEKKIQILMKDRGMPVEKDFDVDEHD